MARPELKKQKRPRQILWSAIGLVLPAAVTVGVSRLKPTAPEVERSTVWTDAVKRGPMLRQVRGLGSLIPSPEFTRQIPAETEATVVRTRMLPGPQVKTDQAKVDEMRALTDLKQKQLEKPRVRAGIKGVRSSCLCRRDSMCYRESESLCHSHQRRLYPAYCSG